MSGSLVEILGGILNFFPNTMIASLFVIGVMTGRLSWILISLGGIVITILTLTAQYAMSKAIVGLAMPGQHIIETCSILPVAKGGDYTPVPSLWVALSAFFATYIFTNALNVYSQVPVRTNKDSFSVQQRKGVGIISMLAVMVLFFFLLIPRYMTSCETILGVVLGLAIGIGGGYLWWRVLDACGPDVYPDIHGVMIGTQPGLLHTNPIACAKK
jgi:hypothetical protein